MDALELSLEQGVDPSRDVALAGCRCGSDGHAILRLLLERQTTTGPAYLASNDDLAVSRATRTRLRQTGVAFLLSGREGGWPAPWWTAQATPAGLRHAAQLMGVDAYHAGTCGGAWDTGGRCLRCGALRPLTIELARRRLAALPAGPERDGEAWASQFVCPQHGRARAAMVRTDKCCALCRTLFIRSTPIEVPS